MEEHSLDRDRAFCQQLRGQMGCSLRSGSYWGSIIRFAAVNRAVDSSSTTEQK